LNRSNHDLTFIRLPARIGPLGNSPGKGGVAAHQEKYFRSFE
jgi:hypothetical protein